MEQRTISGKEMTYPVSFRLTLSHYEKLRSLALREGKTVSELLQEWIIERLEKPFKETNHE